ncbi:SEC-C metal-binding domain-containing protein [Clostridium sp. C2-6-12]|uniref:SEC-C metal-binding domain-containing protein n=1 Tax=Clostridium sp. C2-6-12 TaxID=2698832 RepID=UPI00136B3495|nr:SEC-C metal-binding domain-containing protein [Clostridium sp. C2-6-12]
MSLYTDWTEMVVDYVKTKGENAFWAEYSKLEKSIYKDLLANHKEVKKVTINQLAKDYNSTVEFAMGFMDGINDSLKKQYDLETIDADTELELELDLETLYFNMLDAKAEYLYTLPQWDGIFSEEKRNDIQKQYKESKIVRNTDKVGRNDACPCGSGKKYKKCCGQNK